MTIIRVPERRRFALVDRRTVNDERLTFKAKGLLLWLLDKPDDWSTTEARLAEVGPDGEHAVSTALRELERHGYLDRRKERSRGGRWEVIWTVREVSSTVKTAETPEPPEVEIAPGAEVGPEVIIASLTETERSRTTETERSRAEPETGLALVAPPSPPSRSTIEAEAFDDFWEVYPRRTGKGAARTAFAKARTRAATALIVAQAARFRDDPNRDPAFTPHPATWLNQDRWEDDPLPSRSKPESVGMRLIRRAGAMGATDGQ